MSSLRCIVSRPAPYGSPIKDAKPYLDIISEFSRRRIALLWSLPSSFRHFSKSVTSQVSSGHGGSGRGHCATTILGQDRAPLSVHTWQVSPIPGPPGIRSWNDRTSSRSCAKSYSDSRIPILSIRSIRSRHKVLGFEDGVVENEIARKSVVKIKQGKNYKPEELREWGWRG